MPELRAPQLHPSHCFHASGQIPFAADLYRQEGLLGNTAGRPQSDPFAGLIASTDGIPSLQSAAYVYDGNGNPTTYNNTAITYDQENRITSIGTVMTAGYRADNLRAWKQTAAGRTYYYYDGGVPVLETDASGTVTAQNVFAPDGLVARYQGRLDLPHLRPAGERNPAVGRQRNGTFCEHFRRLRGRVINRHPN